VDFLGIPWNTVTLSVLGLSAVNDRLCRLSGEQLLSHSGEQFRRSSGGG
jgi:hypothetical protein